MKKYIISGGVALCALIAAWAYFFYKVPTKVASLPPLLNAHPLNLKVAGRLPASSKDYRHKRRKNTLLIKLNENASPMQVAQLQALYQEFNLQHEKQLMNGKAVRIKISNKNYDDQEEAVAQKIKDTGAVEFVEPDYHIPPSFVPNDSYYVSEWHHKTIGSEAGWDITQGASTVLVGICDSGFDLTHPDLATQFSLPGYNTVKNNSAIDDVYDHGTMTAGTLAAVGNNSTGVAGMAWKIKLLPIQITDQPDGSSTFSDVAECIQYAADHGAKVVSLSYDYGYASSLVNDAALALRNAGGLLVVAAGNSGADISQWGPSPNMLVVGATDTNDTVVSFSNFGTPVDMVAPGVNIYTTMGGGYYTMVSGTSFSTPLVAGAAALIYSKNPTMTPAQVESVLLTTTTSLGTLGRLNVGTALKMVSQSQNADTPITMDNLKGNASDSSHVLTGSWCTANDAGYFGTKSIYSCGSRTDTYKFIPNIPKAQKYDVAIRYISASGLSTKVPVVIKYRGGQVTKSVNMRINGMKWLSLGTFTFAAGTSNYVQFSDSSGVVNVDGVQFTPVP